MPRAFIPPLLRDLTGDRTEVTVEGATVRQVIDALEQQFPGIKARLCDQDALRPGLIVAVGSSIATGGLRAKVGPDDEVHFLPALGGG
uniref:MoaD/ThiS family protein n=1 Tax=Schlesneria paludicola TaxID=360056 RepID=A0A7C4LL12_9PLAN